MSRAVLLQFSASKIMMQWMSWFFRLCDQVGIVVGVPRETTGIEKGSLHRRPHSTVQNPIGSCKIRSFIQMAPQRRLLEVEIGLSVRISLVGMW